MDVYLSLLKRYWGYNDFRGIQLQIIESIGAGKDTLGLMPTGGGKSITFQVPALAKEGVCIVITPLVSLMKDQVEALRSRGVRAAYIHSGLSHEQILVTLENAVFNAYKLLYVSPERLSSELFQKKLRHMDVSFITVDEAHCICQWGHDFRPSYLEIARIRDIKPHCPVLALTATATPEVVGEIQHNLHFAEENVFRMSFARSNLSYQVCHADASLPCMVQMLDRVPGTCIIYTRNRQKCKDMAKLLTEMGFSATYYHAGLKPAEKDERQEQWQMGKCRIMVATNAFGMGIDKPDVRLVMHIDLPDSIEEYFQEAGRAGRDGKPSTSVIIMDGRELESAKRRTGQHFPQLDYIRKVYEDVCCFFELAVGDGYRLTKEFNMERFCMTFHYHPIMLTSALEILDKAGYIEYRDAEDGRSRLRIEASRNQLFDAIDATSTKVMMSVMRHYGGVFVDYVYIDEDLVRRAVGMDVDAVYQCLKELNKRGLISYVPRKRVPLITFSLRRVDKEELVFSPEAYQRRKEAYERRLGSLLTYCTSASVCRSQLLLEYFGETSSKCCGICDVCQQDESRSISEEEYLMIRSRIMEQLSNGPVQVSELKKEGIRPSSLAWTIDYMCAHEELLTDGCLIRLNAD